MKDIIRKFFGAAIWNFIGQGVNFFTLLYLPRVLGPEGYGIFNFAQSYVMYFLLISDFGLSLYCIKNVNQAKEEQRKRLTLKIFNLRLVLSTLSMILFFISVLLIGFTREERYALYAIGSSILFSGMLIDYIFNAFNQVKYIGIGSAIKNMIFFILCILFVKNESDVFEVSFYYSIGILISAIFLMVMFNKKYFKLNRVNICLKDVKILKKSIPLAVSLFMVQINNNFDIIYLSFTEGQQVVGYYSAAYKIINFLIAILCIYFNTAYPTIAKLVNSDKKELSEFMNKFYSIGVTAVIPIVSGGIILGNQIIVFLFGTSYGESIEIFIILMPLVFIRVVSSTFGAVFLMGDGGKIFTKGVIIGAVVNIVLNILLVDRFSALGAAAATLISESIQGIYLAIKCKKYCDIKIIKKTVIPIISATLMVVIIILFYSSIFINILVGSLSYIIIVIMLNLLFYKGLRKKLKKMINRVKE